MVGEGTCQPGQLSEIPRLEVGEVVLGAGVSQGGVAALGVEEVDELELGELEFQVRASVLEVEAVHARPGDGGEEVPVVSELGEDAVHLLKGVAEGGGVDGVDGGEGFFGGGGVGGRGAWRGWLMRREGDVGEELGCHVELAFAEEVHGDCSIDQGRLRGEGVVVGGGKGFIFEFLEVKCQQSGIVARCVGEYTASSVF